VSSSNISPRRTDATLKRDSSGLNETMPPLSESRPKTTVNKPRVIKAPVEYQIPQDARVKLRDGLDDLYLPNGIPVGSEGWIRERSFLPGNFPMVYIQWDKNHWTYSNQDDLWTYESHFEVVDKDKTQVSEEVEVDPKLVATIVAAMQAVQGQQSTTVAPDDESKVDSRVEKYMEAMENAANAISEGDAFMAIVLKEVEVDGNRGYVPQIISDQQDPEAGFYLQAHLAEFVSNLHQGLLVEKIKNARE
jgi:hypothetical protein